MTKLLLDIFENNGLSDLRSNLEKLRYVYRQPARLGNFSLEHGLLYMKEIFENYIKYVNLWVVTESMRNVIVVAFHANPIGSYHGAFHTFHKIRQRYFWPGMYQYCKRMITAFPVCSLGHRNMWRSAEIFYGFPIYAPVKFLLVNIYAAGPNMISIEILVI